MWSGIWWGILIALVLGLLGYLIYYGVTSYQKDQKGSNANGANPSKVETFMFPQTRRPNLSPGMQAFDPRLEPALNPAGPLRYKPETPAMCPNGRPCGNRDLLPPYVPRRDGLTQTCFKPEGWKDYQVPKQFQVLEPLQGDGEWDWPRRDEFESPAAGGQRLGSDYWNNTNQSMLEQGFNSSYFQLSGFGAQINGLDFVRSVAQYSRPPFQGIFPSVSRAPYTGQPANCGQSE